MQCALTRRAAPPPTGAAARPDTRQARVAGAKLLSAGTPPLPPKPPASRPTSRLLRLSSPMMRGMRFEYRYSSCMQGGGARVSMPGGPLPPLVAGAAASAAATTWCAHCKASAISRRLQAGAAGPAPAGPAAGPGRSWHQSCSPAATACAAGCTAPGLRCAGCPGSQQRPRARAMLCSRRYARVRCARGGMHGGDQGGSCSTRRRTCWMSRSTLRPGKKRRHSICRAVAAPNVHEAPSTWQGKLSDGISAHAHGPAGNLAGTAPAPTRWRQPVPGLPA